MNLKQFILVFPALLFFGAARAQSIAPQRGDSLQVLQQMPAKYLDEVSSKAGKLDEKLDKYTRKALSRFQKSELKLQKKLGKVDSLKAATVFGNASEQYGQLKIKLEKTGTFSHQYIPSLDSLTNSMKFLQQNPQLLSNAKEAKQKLSDAAAKVKGLQNSFQKAEEVKNFIRERKRLLKEQLGELGFAKEFKKLTKQSWYFSQQLNEYKSLLKDHKKAERNALELLSQSKQFKDFMRKNSMLASLFRLPGDDLSPSGGAGGGSLAGLQTKSQVNGLIQQQIAAGGPDAKQQFQQNLQAAQSKMSEIKNNITRLGSENSDEEMPEGFSANSQKTRSFLKRLELGTNVQSQKASNYFPVTSDLGLSLGYKLNDKSVIGVGTSYKLGWGRNIHHIRITQQGVSLRSFVDWKIKGSFWLSGGYEMNYRSEFENVDQLKELNAWQQSGLVGLSKVVSLKTKFFKKTKFQLMWDFLSYQQIPHTQSIVFRVGYNLK